MITELYLDRIYLAPTYTIGKLKVEKLFFCDTLEDTFRKIKIKHETCIPSGRYEIIMTLSTRFKRIMPLLLNVPGFDGIRIHSGNDAGDTSGCILTGDNTIKGKVTGSKIKTDLLYSKIEAALQIGKVFITIK